MNRRMHIILYLLLFFYILALSACAASEQNKTAASVTNGLNQQAMIQVELEPLPIQNVTSTEVQPELGLLFNEFCFAFGKQMETERNFVYSPFSLHSLLTALSMGANGHTKQQLQSALKLPEIDTQYIAYSTWLNHILADGVSDDAQFHHASAIWTDAQFNINKSFVAGLKEHFHTQNQVVDFYHYPADVVDIINKWVSLSTNDMIKDLVPVAEITSETLMVLANAISFDAKWIVPFIPDREISFKKSDGATQTIQGMYINLKIGYYHSDVLEYSAIQVGYVGEKYSMLFILPDEVGGLNALMNSFTSQEFETMINGFELKYVDIFLPKYKIEYEIKKISELFGQMGLGDAFGDTADYSNISNQEITIKFIHKALLEIDQEGTRAAAASVAIASSSSLPRVDASFVADHPFAFAIIHNQSKSILFYGHYYGE